MSPFTTKMYALQDWNIQPFKVLGTDSAGLVAGVALAANGIVFTQSATNVVERVLSASSTLAFTGDVGDYYPESINNNLAFSSSVDWNKERPLIITSTLWLSDNVQVSGGQYYSSKHEIFTDGIVFEGQAIYIKATGHAAVTEADDAIKASVAGIALISGGGVMGGTLYYMTEGTLHLDSWVLATGSVDLTPGAPYYLGTTDGKITATPPTADGEFVVKVGRALNARALAIELGEGTGL